MTAPMWVQGSPMGVQSGGLLSGSMRFLRRHYAKRNERELFRCSVALLRSRREATNLGNCTCMNQKSCTNAHMQHSTCISMCSVAPVVASGNLHLIPSTNTRSMCLSQCCVDILCDPSRGSLMGHSGSIQSRVVVQGALRRSVLCSTVSLLFVGPQTASELSQLSMPIRILCMANQLVVVPGASAAKTPIRNLASASAKAKSASSGASLKFGPLTCGWHCTNIILRITCPYLEANKYEYNVCWTK